MSDAERIRALYDGRPYPPPDVSWGPRHVLSISWLDALRHPGGSIRDPGRRVLLAGCGTGEEAASMAQGLPVAEVVGVDFSLASIEMGRARGGPARLIRADLTDPGLPDALGRFDFILCSAVADYVPDSAALLGNLAALLAPHGLILLRANRDAHPRARVRAGLRRLARPDGLPVDRSALRVVAAIMGDHAGIANLSDLPDALLAVDLFPPFAHDRPLSAWADLAAAAGLSVLAGGSVAAHVAGLPDEDLPVLYGLDRGEAALLVDGLRFDPAFAALLGRGPGVRPPFADPRALDGWIPRRDASLDGLQPRPEGWSTPLSLSVGLGSEEPIVIAVPAPLLGLLAAADGRTLGALRAALPDPGPDALVAAALFRLWHASLVTLHA